MEPGEDMSIQREEGGGGPQKERPRTASSEWKEAAILAQNTARVFTTELGFKLNSQDKTSRILFRP